VDDSTTEISVQEMDALVEEVYRNMADVKSPETETHGSFFDKVFMELIKVEIFFG